MKSEQPKKKTTPFVDTMTPEARRRQSAAIRNYYIKKREAQKQAEKGKRK